MGSGVDGFADDFESMFPEFPPDCTSLLATHLTRALFDSMCRLQTSSGVTVQDCIISGVEFPESPVGIFAGDAECFVLFDPLFAAIVTDLHGYDLVTVGGGEGGAKESGSNKHPASELDADGIAAVPEEAVLGARVRFTRNIEGLSLTPQMTAEQRSDVELTIAGVFEVRENHANRPSKRTHLPPPLSLSPACPSVLSIR